MISLNDFTAFFQSGADIAIKVKSAFSTDQAAKHPATTLPAPAPASAISGYMPAILIGGVALVVLVLIFKR